MYKLKTMKIKDLDPKTNLGGLKVKTTTGEVGYWESQWNKGVWLSREGKGGRVFPIFIEDLKETMEWEVGVEDDVNLN